VDENMDSVWQVVNSLSERVEELEARVSLLEEELEEDGLDISDPYAYEATNEEEEKVMGNIMDGLKNECQHIPDEDFEGEVTYDSDSDNDKAST